MSARMSSTAKQIRAVALKIHFSQVPAFSWNQSKAVYLAVGKNNFKIQGTLSQCGCPFCTRVILLNWVEGLHRIYSIVKGMQLSMKL